MYLPAFYSKQYVLAKLQVQRPVEKSEYLGAGPTRKDGHNKIIINVKGGHLDTQYLVGHHHSRSWNGKICKGTG